MVWAAWTEAMAVGDAALDSDHRIIINLLNQLHDAMETGQSRDVLGSVVKVLAEYTEHHFAREEAAMAACGYPDMESHRREHQALCTKVREIHERYLAGERTALDESVVRLLRKWLTDHIQVTDKSYRPWVEQPGASGGSVKGKQGTNAAS
ncbi:MAG: bacteriohemerythrin [Actinomycetota bacterium]